MSLQPCSLSSTPSCSGVRSLSTNLFLSSSSSHFNHLRRDARLVFTLVLFLARVSFSALVMSLDSHNYYILFAIFQVWTELRRPKVGGVNFHTGMGGFLQTLMFGYAGIRIHLDRLEIIQPQLPPEATKFRIKGELFFKCLQQG